MAQLPSRRQGYRRAGTVALALAGLVALGGCDATEDSDLERGRAMFIQNCGTCHALAEAGTSAQVGPDLDASFAQARATGMDSDTVEGVVQHQISNPRATKEGVPDYTGTYMPADLVTGQDAEDVAAYVASVAGVPGAKPPPLGTPAELFTEKCASCHTLAPGGGDGTGPNLGDALAGKDAAYIEQQIVDPNSEIAKGFSEGVMPQDFGQTIPKQNLDQLVQYILGEIKGGS